MSGLANSHGLVVNQDDLRKAKRTFYIFLFAFIFATAIMSKFSQGEDYIFNLGSLLTFSSVLHTRFFDIKKNAFHQDIKSVTLREIGSTLLILEKLFSWLWVLGSILLFISHYTK